MSEIIKVGMADLKTCVSPNGVTTLGLGSCVGIAIRDTSNKIGGLAHIMLPDSKAMRGHARSACAPAGQEPEGQKEDSVFLPGQVSGGKRLGGIGNDSAG